MNRNRNTFALFAVTVLSLLGAGRAKADSIPVTCGDVITAPGKYYLSGDCTGNGIQINASNVDLNLAGHTLTAGDPSVVGVTVAGGSDVRVHDGTITHGLGGVYLYGTTGCLVDHVTVMTPDGLHYEIGMSDVGIFNGNKNRIDSCHTKDGYFAISIYGPADGNVLSNNLVEGWSVMGIRLFGASNTVVKENTFMNTLNAIYDESGANNTITQNTTLDCVAAVVMINTFGTVVRDNTLSAYFNGIYAYGGGSNRLVHNSCSGDSRFPFAGTGIFIFGPGPGYRVEGNTCSSNQYGIYIWDGSTGNVIKNNIALNNAIYDLEDDNPGPPLPNTWMNNTFGTTNQPGVIH